TPRRTAARARPRRPAPRRPTRGLASRRRQYTGFGRKLDARALARVRWLGRRIRSDWQFGGGPGPAAEGGGGGGGRGRWSGRRRPRPRDAAGGADALTGSRSTG